MGPETERVVALMHEDWGRESERPQCIIQLWISAVMHITSVHICTAPHNIWHTHNRPYIHEAGTHLLPIPNAEQLAMIIIKFDTYFSIDIFIYRRVE